jgi:hypothetical protein
MNNVIFWDVTACVALARGEISEERITFIIRVKRICELGTT